MTETKQKYEYTIPLFHPLPAPRVLGNITGTHYRDMAAQAEQKCREFLGFADKPEVGLLLFDRATHAIKAVCYMLKKECGVQSALIPARTFKAVRDAVQTAGMEPYVSRKEEVPGAVMADTQHQKWLAIPTTLGGTKPVASLMPKQYPVVYDCAHTCHPVMFEGIEFGPANFAVVSFYPTKPAGAFGGGLLIGQADVIDKLRPRAQPTDPNVLCWFDYPQTIQSWGIFRRLSTFNLEMWGHVRHDAVKLREWVCWTQKLADLVWPDPQFPWISPHMLVVTRTPELVELCKRAQVETGNHYPYFPKTPGDAREYLSLPVHTPETLARFKEVR